MILGIFGVIDIRNIEVGSFYLKLDYNLDPVIFQCIDFGENEDGVPIRRALSFYPETDRKFHIEELPDRASVVALPPVHIRVDAPSVFASKHTSSLRPGMFLVSGDEAFVIAPFEFRGWQTIDLLSGRVVQGNWSRDWLAFSRWLLVINENGEEIPIASFDASKADP